MRDPSNKTNPKRQDAASTFQNEATGQDAASELMREWRCGASRFRAIPEHGARLCDWHLMLAGGRSRPILHWPESWELADMEMIRGGNPILFPFAGRSWHKDQIGFWEGPDGVVRPMPMHGVARQSRFELCENRPDGFLAEMIWDAAARESYPFPCRFTVDYQFAELALTVVLTLENLGSSAIPWAAGHHFYFRLPWHEGAERGDYRLEISAREALRMGSHGKLLREATHPSRDLPLRYSFTEEALSNRIFIRCKSPQVRFGPKSGEEDLIITLGEEDRPHAHYSVVTWTETDQSPFYCVEPWMAPPNAEGNKLSHWVDPGESARFVVRIAL